MSNANTTALPEFGWPWLLTTPRAVIYTGCSRHALMRAARAGLLAPVGRRSRTLIWRRTDLDRWLTSFASGIDYPILRVLRGGKAGGS